METKNEANAELMRKLLLIPARKRTILEQGQLNSLRTSRSYYLNLELNRKKYRDKYRLKHGIELERELWKRK